jgi:hypothetical protein
VDAYGAAAASPENAIVAGGREARGRGAEAWCEVNRVGIDVREKPVGKKAAATQERSDGGEKL